MYVTRCVSSVNGTKLRDETTQVGLAYAVYNMYCWHINQVYYLVLVIFKSYVIWMNWKQECKIRVFIYILT